MVVKPATSGVIMVLVFPSAVGGVRVAINVRLRVSGIPGCTHVATNLENDVGLFRITDDFEPPPLGEFIEASISDSRLSRVIFDVNAFRAHQLRWEWGVPTSEDERPQAEHCRNES
jgi:hypothetical protein